MIEFTLIAPFVFLFVFGIMFFGHIYSARVSLATAVGSVRTGFTRGAGGYETISEIDDYLLTPTGSLYSPPAMSRLRQMLASSDLDGAGPGLAFGANGIYSQMLDSVYPGHVSGNVGLRHLPPSKLYSLVFINQMMAQSIGSSLRYPCQEKGCLYCEFKPDPNVPDEPSTDYNGITCSYRPSSLFLDPVLSLLSLISGGLVNSDIVLTKSRVYKPIDPTPP